MSNGDIIKESNEKDSISNSVSISSTPKSILIYFFNISIFFRPLTSRQIKLKQ